MMGYDDDEETRPILGSQQPSAPTSSYHEIINDPPTYEQSNYSNCSCKFLYFWL